MVSKFSYVLAIIFTFVVMISCKKDTTTIVKSGVDSVEEKVDGTLNIKINGMVDNESFVMYNNYVNDSGQTYRVESIRFYVGDISLYSKGYENNVLSDVNLVDLLENHTSSGGQELLSVNVPEGHYDGLSFAIGLDTATNHSDPSIYLSSDPLSSFQNTHWDWNQGYKFLMVDGKIDSDGDGIPEQSFSYHIGLDDYYKIVDFSSDTFRIAAGEETDFLVSLNINSLFVGVDVLNDGFTHSTSNFPLVETIASNSAEAFYKN
ncbi:MAG: hypothetical protein JKY53_02780 [Flavobacteriales bacterium]|nr:hypothetical protein [Flavobacteriales bacterium]